MAELTKRATELLRAVAGFGDTGTYVKDAKAVKDLEAAGYVETNRDVTDDSGNIAVRVTEAGTGFVSDASAVEETPDEPAREQEQEREVASEAPAATPRTKPPVSAIVTGAPIPKAARRANGSGYPFDQLEEGQSFFVAATERTPEPVRTLSSTCSRENARYAEETGNTTTNRKGEPVPETRLTRRFIARKVDDGAPWGDEFSGVSGCAVYRIAVE